MVDLGIFFTRNLMIFEPKRRLRAGDLPSPLEEKPRDSFRITQHSSGPEVESLSDAGRAYAAALLDELARTGEPLEEGAVIEDWPDFNQRAFMLDISRNRVPTMAWTKELIDALARLRYNELQLYTEHTFAYRDHEIVWRDASAFTAAEIREIDVYCRDRNIELVPNQNSFGHMERWLKLSPYRHLAECPDGFEHALAGKHQHGKTLYPSEESERFVDSLFQELLPNFSSRRLNVGGDEPFELGMGRSADRVAKEGKHAVYLEFLGRILQLAKSHGRHPMFWADVILEDPEAASQLPRDITPVVWGYDEEFPFASQCRTFSEAGFKNNFYVAPGAGNWRSFGGRLDVAKSNITLAAAEGKRNQACGLLLTAWGDIGHHQPWVTLFPGLVMGAQAAWGGVEIGDDLAAHIDRIFYPSSPAGNGEAIYALGKIDAMLPQPQLHESLLHVAFFCDEDHLQRTVKLAGLDRFKECSEALARIDTDGLDPEIALGIDLNRFGLNRCFRALGAVDSADEAAPDLEELKTRFQELWLLRCRPGGLSDSLARMSVVHCGENV